MPGTENQWMVSWLTELNYSRGTWEKELGTEDANFIPICNLNLSLTISMVLNPATIYPYPTLKPSKHCGKAPVLRKVFGGN